MIMIKKKEAFTLIELVMVMVIIGLLAVVVMFSAPGSVKLSGVAHKLMFDLRYAQQLAISRGESCGVSFNPSGNSYFVYIGDIGTKAADPHTRQNLSIDYDTDSHYAGVDLFSTDFGDQLSFDYLGTPYDSSNTALSGPGRVVLQQGADTQNITIEPNTGAVKIP